MQLDKLKRSYHKLQCRQLKDTKSGANAKEKGHSEDIRLNEKIEVKLYEYYSVYILSLSYHFFFSVIYW